MTSEVERRMAAHYRRRRNGQRRGLHRVGTLVARLGDPHHAYPCVHVTGTNGKTTVTHLLGDMLAAHRLRVGTFTSPHLVDVRERIVVDGAPVAEAAFLAALDRVEAHVRETERATGVEVTFFELMTATAGVVFADAGVDAAVIEVGIGGRRDPTNIHHGEVAVITSVGLDHPELGRTTAAVAREKAGIFEPGHVGVVGPVDARARSLIRAEAERLGVRLLAYGEHAEVTAAEDTPRGQHLRVRLGEAEADFAVPLRGRHQGINATVALTAAEAFLSRRGGFDPRRARAAMAAAHIPGRMEHVIRSGRPDVLLDVAHNEEAAQALAATAASWLPARPLALVLAAGRGRDIRAVGRPLARLAEVAYLVGVERAAPPRLETHGDGRLPLVPVASVAEVLERAEQHVGATGIVLVTGSHQLVGQARDELQRSGLRVGPAQDAAVFDAPRAAPPGGARPTVAGEPHSAPTAASA